jgi:hypothetical protein
MDIEIKLSVMVEYYGWISIHLSTDGEGEDNIDPVISEIQLSINQLSASNRILILKPINGTYVVNLSGITNHWTRDVDEAVALFRFIGEKAKGSYGLLYLHNDEDNNGLKNELLFTGLVGVWLNSCLINFFRLVILR